MLLTLVGAAYHVEQVGSPPARIDNPGQLALVVDPQVGGYKFTKVLMDGGSSINILYYETFRRMGLTDKDLRPSNTVFHGGGFWGRA